MIVELLAFALVVLIGQFSPGPDMLLLTRTALEEGRKSGLFMVLGIVTGLAFHATLAIGGMAMLVSQEGWASTLMRVLAASYLIWLAIGLLKKQDQQNKANELKRSPYLRGLFCNLLNPKVLVFFASLVAPFLTGGRPDWWSAALWIIIIGEGVLFWSLWVYFLQIERIRNTYRNSKRLLDLIFAVLLFGLAMNLLFQAS